MDNLFPVITNENFGLTDEITSSKSYVNKRTGEKIARFTTKDGSTYIGRLTASGIQQASVIKIPPYTSKEERNNLIRELYKKGYTQDEIADILGISQGTVSKVLHIINL